MYAIKVIAFVGLIVTALMSSAIAAEKPFTGVFQGSGRQCYGKLFIRTKTIEWHTPFAVCKRTPYKILKNNLDAAKPEIVFLLKGKGSKFCDFGVITLDWNSEYPGYWNATGFRSHDDYERDSDDKLRCNLEIVEK